MKNIISGDEKRQDYNERGYYDGMQWARVPWIEQSQLEIASIPEKAPRSWLLANKKKLTKRR
jgi:hypothetical protein